MKNIPRTSVHDFIYNTIGGNVRMCIQGAHNQYIKEPFYEGTPNDLFDNHPDIAEELKNWTAEGIWVDKDRVLVLTCSGGKTPEWLSEYGKDPQGWYEREMIKTFGPEWKEKHNR